MTRPVLTLKKRDEPEPEAKAKPAKKTRSLWHVRR
jgi:hypothetical protein